MTKTDAGRTGVAVIGLWCLGLSFVGCGEDRGPRPSPAAVAGTGASAVTPTGTVQSDGSLELRPRIRDVAVLELQPDGTYLRKCGPVSPETGSRMADRMAEKMAGMRARRGAK